MIDIQKMPLIDFLNLAEGPFFEVVFGHPVRLYSARFRRFDDAKRKCDELGNGSVVKFIITDEVIYRQAYQ